MQVYEILIFDGIDDRRGAVFLTAELAEKFLERDGFKVGENGTWESLELDEDGDIFSKTTANILTRNVVTALQQIVAPDRLQARSSPSGSR
jgi:hypothetical protein